jgi:hypothetical protein
VVGASNEEALHVQVLCSDVAGAIRRRQVAARVHRAGCRTKGQTARGSRQIAGRSADEGDVGGPIERETLEPHKRARCRLKDDVRGSSCFRRVVVQRLQRIGAGADSDGVSGPGGMVRAVKRGARSKRGAGVAIRAANGDYKVGSDW